MYILGLNIGHNATAALLKNGKIIHCCSEERFSRIKNHAGIPHQSIKYILEEEGITSQELSFVVLDDHYEIGDDPQFGKRFLEAYTQKHFVKKILSTLGYSFPGFFAQYLTLKEPFEKRARARNANTLKEKISEYLHLPESKVLIIDHHIAHAYSPCFNLPRDKKTLIFTLDGEGSGAAASVNVFDGEKITPLARSPKSTSLGYLYSLTTIHLGMKPLEHEFKVMGLAPYAKEANIAKIYPIFSKLIRVNNDLTFSSTFNMPFFDIFLKKEMEFKRFDVLAGAVQRVIEEKSIEWIKKAIAKTGIKRIALAGGVFMNVKANLRIAELPEVEDLFVMPSCGDESNPLGGCFFGYLQYCLENQVPFTPLPLKDLYLGPEYSEEYIQNMLKDKELQKRFFIKKMKNPSKEIALLLAKGEIVARCSGRSEWGARALGNRSILANPSDPETIKTLNETIKDRDFWMPFTPSILDSYSKKYLVNKKNIFCPYMALTFHATSLAQKHLPAAMHPYDATIRPQVVTVEYNSDYFSILTHFEKATGKGGVLNTSFNLHGEPNVLTPEDAIRTVTNSGLKYLALGNYLLSKRM